MNDLWINIKFWIKTTLITVVVVYLLMFIYMNAGEAVKFWYFPLQDRLSTSVLYLTISTFAAGVLSTILLHTTLKTMKQYRLMKALKAQKELDEMKAKALKLKTSDVPIENRKSQIENPQD